MEYLTRKSQYDCVYLVVSPQNPFKDASKALSARRRVEAAREAVARHPGLKVKVEDIELDMEPPQYTIRTLDALRQREPENEFTLVIGADNLDGFRGWRDYRRILREYGVVVFPREGFKPVSLRRSLLEEDGSYMIKVVRASEVNISSTRIREGIAGGEDMSQYLM